MAEARQTFGTMRLMASGGDVACFRKSKEARPQATQIRLVLFGVIDMVG